MAALPSARADRGDAVIVVVADRHPALEGSSSEGGSVAQLVQSGAAMAALRRRLLWISPAATADLRASRRGDLVVQRVGVSPAVHAAYYLTVGAARIWPALHGLPAPLPARAVGDEAWSDYVAVNRAIARTVAASAPAGACVAVHDYSLVLAVPEIRRLRPDLRLAYVHHTPWPHRDDTEATRRPLLEALFRAGAAAHAVCVSAARWRTNLATWGTLDRVAVVHPGVDSGELRRRARKAAKAGGAWASFLREGRVERPIVAWVGRADPAKNADTLLEAWSGLVDDGIRGTLCLHSSPTSRANVAIYREYAEAVRAGVEAANRSRPGSVVAFERDDPSDALVLLEQADVVVACSRADGWNLVAAEAAVLGSRTPELVLSSHVGAVDLLGPVARVVANPYSVREVADAVRDALRAVEAGTRARGPVTLPTPADWWQGILSALDDEGTQLEQDEEIPRPRETS